MIPITRVGLPGTLSHTLAEKTAVIAASQDRQKRARTSWNDARTTRSLLKAELVTMCARPAFCMYCYESRGTDVDHFVPISRDPLLTFEWSNHVLACGYCNQQAKRERFPLDPAGHPLLIDPGIDDSADHMTLGTSGRFIELTDRGAETIRTLGLNDRSELVRARFESWQGVIGIFEDAARNKRVLAPRDVERLLFLPVVDAFHHFAHDVRTGRLTRKAVTTRTIACARRSIPVLRAVFPLCAL